MHEKLAGFPQPAIRECPACEAVAARPSLQVQQFEYGAAADRAILSAEVQVWTCDECGFEFTGGDAEELRHAAVCKHLGLLSPGEIIALRKRLGLSQADFAELTKFGEASIKRWEAGAVLQNVAADNLLRVIDDANGCKIVKRIAQERAAIAK